MLNVVWSGQPAAEATDRFDELFGRLYPRLFGLAYRLLGERTETEDLLQGLSVRPARPEMRVNHLSGGNQQKVLFAKWLFGRPQLLIADEPTRGVDVGAKRAIYDLLASLAADGLGVLLISSEIEEVIGVAHRVLVMRRGRIIESLEGDDVTEDGIMHAAFATTSLSPAEGQG